MITRLTVYSDGEGGWYGGVVTDNGGDQTYGPFESLERAKHALASRAEEDFDPQILPGADVDAICD